MASDEPEHYLAVLKASYDYEPQSDDEISIKEDQLLLLVEKVDDDWWKVKIKAANQEAESPIGLVPAAYVEQAEHTSIVKAVYDYDAAAPGELSIVEDDLLWVFETEDDWILAQNSKAAKAGYVPGNYVEVVDEEEDSIAPTPSTRIVVPDSPPRPVSSYVDPADRVASSKVTADDIQTWSVSEIDKKGKKKKGTLGIGNGAVFFASEADKTPVQKWQTKDVTSASSEKSKHVTIEIGGPNPITLNFHTGSKDNADSILVKLNRSKAISAGQSNDTEAHSPSLSPPPDEPTTREPKNVHFSTTSTIIPPSHEVENQEEEGYPEEDDQSNQAVALYDFNADGDDELTVIEGEHLTILEKDGDEWWKCQNKKGQVGVVPASYLEVVGGTENDLSAQQQDAEREAQERAAQELARRQQEETDRERRRKEQEENQRAAARQLEIQQKAKAEAAIAAEVERKKRQEQEVAARASSPAAPAAQVSKSSRSVKEPEAPKSSSSSSSRPSSELGRPSPDKIRVWHDRSGQFRVEAQFLGFNNGKLRLHKVNGVIVEVPSEKMSLDDMRFVERHLDKRQQRSLNPPRVSEDDIPLGITHPKVAAVTPPPPKKAPKIDWFDFFLSAGCDLDDCTRYASSFERDKIDETLLADITEGTMRSLGLREGDIMRVKKAIDKRKPTDNLHKPSPYIEDQMRRDEELARQLQAQEAGTSPRAPAPNLFAGPGGVLKAPRRGRPQTTKSLPANVDIKSISTLSDQIQRTSSPQTASPSHPGRPGSAAPASTPSAPVASGFDDDAWTNRTSSTKPIKAVSPTPPVIAPTPPPQAATTVAPLQPAATPTIVSTPPQPAPTAIPTVTVPSTSPAATAAPYQVGTAPSLAKTSDSDVFDQIARLSALRQNSTPLQHQNTTPAFNPVPPPPSFRAGLGMGSSPLPMGQIAAQPTLSPIQAVPYNGPRGPFAPVPANQGLLQPLIPTQTGFNGFIPTKPNNSPSPFSNQFSPPNFLSQQPTGFSTSQPLMTQPTGMYSNFTPPPSFQATSGFGPVQSHITGFVPPNSSANFGNINGFSSPPASTSQSHNNTSPANVFAQMKSGTFANEESPAPSTGIGMNGQTPGWGQSYQGYTGY